MKKKLLSILAILCCFYSSTAQTAGDVLERGVRVKPGEKIFIKYEDKVVKADIGKSLQDVISSTDYTTVIDSTIFLISKNGVNIYLRPLNPLNHSYTKEIKEVPDEINKAAATAGEAIFEIIKDQRFNIAFSSQEKISFLTPPFEETTMNLRNLQNLLKKDQKEEIIKTFNRLKALSFIGETSTASAIDKIMVMKDTIANHFNDVDELIDETKDIIESNTYEADEAKNFITKYNFTLILKDLTSIAEEQKKRLTNLELAFNMVRKAYSDASDGGGDIGLKWCIKLAEVPANGDKISIFTISIKEEGYQLSEDDEIIATETKELLKKTIRVRKFQLFVPEISVGTAYTFFKYNSYGTTTDASGQIVVASPTENAVRNINISTMINWNLYCENSPINPLIQIGAGINSDIPTILVGGGLRFSNNSKNRIRITGGIAMTWIKELDKLKVGDVISGTDDIDKDLKYQFSWPPKPYIGIQYNF